MNSYPVELLAQHVPLMFVAGLTDDLPQSPGPTSPSVSRSTSGTMSSAPSSGSVGAASAGMTTSQSGDSSSLQDPFTDLVSRLRTALTYRKKGVVWDPNRAKGFQIILVDRVRDLSHYLLVILTRRLQNVRFPPRKVYPPSPSNKDGTPAAPSGTPRSPLSPMTLTSPVFPDGLITPLWVRKHIELVPSVFVLFLRLAEISAPTSPLEGRDESIKEEERKRDGELATEIGARKKVTGERGIKLTVVLLASRRMLGTLECPLPVHNVSDGTLASR